MNDSEPPKVLTIAGSDSGGAAGLAADLRTFAALRVYGMGVITAVTAQNSHSITAVHYPPPDLISAQLMAVLSDYGANAVKTGFLGRVEIITAVAEALQQYAVPHLVVDPVLVNHKGQAMFPPEVTEAYLRLLFPLAELITPNRREAELLTGLTLKTVTEMETAVTHLHALGPRNVLLKAGRLGGEMHNVFYDGRTITHLPSQAIDTANTHGAGDTLSAATAAFLAIGEGMWTAVSHAHTLTHQAIRRAAQWQMGQGHGPVWPLE
ncbi:MAG: bifunctional hydroxymethylpyrimidine kinase/phosphomethylpyrimidine kinase [Ardenticatenaceae bacterium]|nr:bifunctional hydroxymethylpyrimidine kinase/phosphomethylpyrimidine kinase [Anaerolineales bacterium]MCB8922845.1 bifunctional hydroxymethylpyrimidine kinase/phosphomethylpyrimidine kinase [Ardenticatenaceae bacterium]MCB9005424.1 bifunctional hydroxymethylpyrimidine kinase/phosphomethylpyrimidine kinase [Ardenticatenaceae bacterium]